MVAWSVSEEEGVVPAYKPEEAPPVGFRWKDRDLWPVLALVSVRTDDKVCGVEPGSPEALVAPDFHARNH